LPLIADIHVHVQPWEQIKPDVLAKLKGKHERGYLQALMTSTERFVQYLDEEGIQVAALINYVAPDVMGFQPSVNEWVSKFCAGAPSRLLPVGSVHPLHVSDAEAETRRLIDELGIRMLKVHGPHMLFMPNAYVDGLKGLGDVYRVAQEKGVPVMVHTGTSFFPGARIKYGDPLALDDVAVDFPELKILMAHGGRPLWTETAWYLLRRHSNLHLDISGIPPSRLLEWFPRLEEVADKVLFGSDWPEPTVKGMGANARAVQALPLPDDVLQKILWDNAARMFGLQGPIGPG
jgi:hypothetical protein